MYHPNIHLRQTSTSVFELVKGTTITKKYKTNNPNGWQPWWNKQNSI